jgi:hypothetical protein
MRPALAQSRHAGKNFEQPYASREANTRKGIKSRWRDARDRAPRVEQMASLVWQSVRRKMARRSLPQKAKYSANRRLRRIRIENRSSASRRHKPILRTIAKTGRNANRRRRSTQSRRKKKRAQRLPVHRFRSSHGRPARPRAHDARSSRSSHEMRRTRRSTKRKILARLLGPSISLVACSHQRPRRCIARHFMIRMTQEQMRFLS